MSPAGTTNSGWCLRPYSAFSKDQHDKCPKNFATGGVCGCDCAHPAERDRASLVSGRDWPASWRAALDGKAVSEVAEALDKTAQPVYTERVPTEGGAEALRKLHKGDSHERTADNGSQPPEPEA